MPSSAGRMVIVALAPLLLSAAYGQAIPKNETRSHIPVYFTPSLFTIGARRSVDGSGGLAMSALTLSLTIGPVREGITLIDADMDAISPAVLHLGLTLWRRPVKYYRSMYGMLPDIYIMASVSPFSFRLDPPPEVRRDARLELRADLDYKGLGLTLGAGARAVKWHRYSPTGYYYSWTVTPTLEARVRLATTNFGL